jgi:hypothetical protein
VLTDEFRTHSFVDEVRNCGAQCNDVVANRPKRAFLVNVNLLAENITVGNNFRACVRDLFMNFVDHVFTYLFANINATMKSSVRPSRAAS